MPANRQGVRNSNKRMMNTPKLPFIAGSRRTQLGALYPLPHSLLTTAPQKDLSGVLILQEGKEAQ